MKILSNIFKENTSSNKLGNSTNFSRRKKPESGLFDFLELINRWPQMIGEKIAKVTKPIRINNKKLIIYTAHSAFSQQLSLMQEQVIIKIKEIYPEVGNQIKKLSFITNGAYFSDKKKNMLSAEQRNDYQKDNKLNKFSPTYRKNIALAKELFQDIDDKELRESLTKIYITSKDH